MLDRNLHEIPAAVTGALSTAAVVGSNHISAKRNAALVTAYALSDSMLHEYRKRVVEKLGEKKEQEIRDDIDREAVEQNPPSKDVIVMSENSANTLCFDAGFGRYFHSDIETIRRAVNRLNHDMMNGFYGYTSLNRWNNAKQAEEKDRVKHGI